MPSSSTIGSAIGSAAARRVSLQRCPGHILPFFPLCINSWAVRKHFCTLRPSQESYPSRENLRRLGANTLQFYPSRYRLQRTNSSRSALTSKFFSTAAIHRTQELDKQPYHVSQQEAEQLVDTYEKEPYSGNSLSDTSTPQDPLSNRASDSRTYRPLAPQTLETLSPMLQELRALILDPNSDENRIWRLYQSIPEPRGQYAVDITRSLISRLSTVKYKTSRGFIRYTSLVSDLKASNHRVSLDTWNTAISYAGRCLKRATANEVESALNIWREMEQEAQVQGDHITFNILFDVAAKAQRFVLADMIVREMKARKLDFTRHFRTSMIYYYGLRKDGYNVRKAYAELVNAGEIVDTAVINCVIFALIHCGEPAAAELVFERAKELHASKVDPSITPTHWYQQRMLGRKLSEATQRQRMDNRKQGLPETHDSDETAELREKTSVAPSTVTYRILIHHHAVTMGDINRAAELIDEMDQYQLQLHGSIFLWLFYSFDAHGGVPYSQWTWRRLESSWTAFVAALDAYPSAEEFPRAASTAPDHKTGDDRPFFEANKTVQQWSQTDSFVDSQQSHDWDYTAEDHKPTSLPPTRETNEEEEEEEEEVQIAEPWASDNIDPPLGQGLYRSTDELSEDPSIYISRVMALVIGKAFARCSHLGRTAQIWAEIRARWTPDVANDMADVENEIAALFPGREQFFHELVETEEAKGRRWR